MDEPPSIARRRLVTGAALAAGVAVAGGLAPAAAAADDKVSQKEAKYRDQPNGQQRCEICLQFNPPGSCKIVAGKISPHGWCQYFAARENAR